MPLTPIGLETFQLILPFAGEMPTWLIVGPVAVMLKVSVTVVMLLPALVAVIWYLCVPAARRPSEAE